MRNYRTLFGAYDRPLTGPESRALRTACGLERRHVTGLANALRVREVEVTNSQVASWERSAREGFPNPLRDALWRLESAIERLAKDLMDHGLGQDFPSYPGRVQTLRFRQLDPDAPIYLHRPTGGRRCLALLHLAEHDMRLADDQLEILDRFGEDFFPVLFDMAVTRAALWLKAEGKDVSVVLDKESV